MVVQRISGGDEESSVLVTSLYEQFGQVPAQLFQMRPFGMVLAGRTAGIIEASLVQRTHTRVELAVSARTGCVVNPQAATACWRVSCGYVMLVKIFRR